MKNAICDKRYAISKIGIIFVLALFCLILSQTAQAATYYLDAVNGDDNNSGTTDAPWKTLNRAYTWYSGTGLKVQEGDTVYFRDGDYGIFREHTNDGAKYLFYRNNWITYKADAGHTPTLTSISIQNLDKWGGAGNGRSYLIFDGFKISDGVVFRDSSYIQILNCEITTQPEPYTGYYAPYFGLQSGIVISKVNHAAIENNDIHGGYRGIDTEDTGNYLTIKGNTIHQLSMLGIDASCYSYQTIEDNLIYDVWKYRGPTTCMGTKTGTFITGEDVILQGTAATGIVFNPNPTYGQLQIFETSQTDFRGEWKAGHGDTIVGQTSGATLSSITQIDPIHSDCIQFNSGNATNVVIRGNILMRISTFGAGGDGVLKLDSKSGPGIYVDTIENNLFWGPKPIYGGGNTPVTNFQNNTLCSLGDWYGGEGDGIEHASLVITNVYNNIFACKLGGMTPTNHGNNIFRHNPPGFSKNPTELVYYDVSDLFVDAANGDFRLKGNSVARDFSDPAHAPATDILGNPRDAQPDAGCYEYGVSVFLYGDVSSDSQISAYDAALTAQAAVDLITLTPEQFSAADVDGSNDISAYDAALIAQYSVGLISKFPVEP